ncbi:hypothetical protein J113_24590 [Mycobacterium tuberculosis CAS/NITR204]|uniref:Uncharacterized protein n=1 Tax=Mycobacterium tuberculosis CAS/NITR204 TaxID=1310114 RepID=R4MJG7_MYCTX|nr:hypothetical protein J113_24590 [Mycobacterium tuberculosis CAS/NITR204]
MDRGVCASQPVPRQRAGGNRFAAEEWFDHDRSVPSCTDTAVQRELRAENRPKSRPQFTLGA